MVDGRIQMTNRPTPPKISIQDARFTYTDDGTQALKGVSLDIESHQIFVLFGPSRSGKTTLLRLLNRLSDLIEDASVEGTIRLDGQDIFDPAMPAPELRRRGSMVFAIPTPLPGSIRENLAYGLKRAGTRDPFVLEERIKRSLQQAAL